MGKTSKEAITLLWAFCFVLVANCRVASGQEHEHHGARESVGEVEFRVLCNAEAQRSFTRGVALLHSFTYKESAEAFRDAAAKDSRCAMAHWGLAMTEYNQMWEPYPGPAELQRAENLTPEPEAQPQVAAISHWAAALGAAHNGNLQAAKAHTEQVRRLSGELKEKGDTYWAEQVAFQSEEAAGWVAFAEHRTYDALRLLRMAADHEDATEKHAVTPGAIRPARELLGDLLMEMHQPKEALAAYRQVLTVAPGRRRALKGAAEAERLAAVSGN